MSKLHFRGSIAGVALVAALLSTSPAVAQVYAYPGPPREPGGLVNELVTGVEYDRVNQALAIHRLQSLQAKISRDGENCDPAAVERDARRIENLRYRISIDEWLIRKNSLQEPCFYPAPIRLDPLTCSAIAQASRPPERPIPMQGARMVAPLIFVTIGNSQKSGPSVSFAVDGVPYQASAGSRQDLTLPMNSIITFDSGGSLGQSRYLISAGRYEFRSTTEGWVLYKLQDKL